MCGGSEIKDGVNFQWDKMIPVITLSWELSDNTAAHSVIFSHPILVSKDGEEQEIGEACSGAIDLFVRDNKPFT